MGNVFQNMEEITTVIPYGKFFRQLHYGSGQLFVIMMLLHGMDHFVRGRYRRYSLTQWSLLIIPLVFCLFTLFTGFILKGDQEGTFAGYIMMNILRQVPGTGDSWTYLFIEPGEAFFFLPYLYHCFFLPLIILLLLKDHIREWLPDLRLK
jgi:ubiquinol-cytochrome c reductase cytochrome b subunit